MPFTTKRETLSPGPGNSALLSAAGTNEGNIMHVRFLTKAFLSTLVLGMALAVDAANGPPPQRLDDPDAVESRLENLQRLLGKSASTKRIEESDNDEAKRLKAEAEEHVKAAGTLLQDGQTLKASEQLQLATDKMFTAIRAAGAGQVGEEKKRHDFNDRFESTNVLVLALERIAEEKGQQQRYAGEIRAIRAKMDLAQRRADKGDMVAARSDIDGAYEEAKAAVEGLRQGDTLVRSLNFANKEEEYRYELDRNDTHQMLVKVLLEDRALDARAQEAVDQRVKTASGLRKKAEKEAASGDFGAAVTTLEAATKELVRAIRSAGVYIPG
jgi:hypothetical protein